VITRSIPLAVAFAVLLGLACQQSGSATAAKSSPSPSSHAARGQTSERGVSQPVQSATPRPAARRPAGNSPSLSATYANALQVDAQHLQTADGARVTNCAGKSMSACRSALQDVGASAKALQRDLDAHPAPSCMKSADATLRTAISLYLQGVALGVLGIDQGSASQLAQGKGLLDQGTAQFHVASSQLGQSACSAPPPARAP